MLGPCLGHLCWNDLKMPIFPPRAPSWSPKQRKNRGFVTSPRWNPLPPKGPKHRKKWCFWTPQAQNTVNYVGFSRSGVGWGVVRRWVGGRGGSARAAWPAPGFPSISVFPQTMAPQMTAFPINSNLEDFGSHRSHGSPKGKPHEHHVALGRCTMPLDFVAAVALWLNPQQR